MKIVIVIKGLAPNPKWGTEKFRGCIQTKGGLPTIPKVPFLQDCSVGPNISLPICEVCRGWTSSDSASWIYFRNQQKEPQNKVTYVTTPSVAWENEGLCPTDPFTSPVTGTHMENLKKGRSSLDLCPPGSHKYFLGNES